MPCLRDVGSVENFHIFEGRVYPGDVLKEFKLRIEISCLSQDGGGKVLRKVDFCVGLFV